jgi:hypothetical protein
MRICSISLVRKTPAPASPLPTKLPTAIAWRIAPAGVSLRDVRRRGAHQAPKLVAVGPGSTINEVNSEGRDFLSGRFDEAFDALFGCVIQAEGRVRDLAVFGRDLNNSPAALLPQVRNARADDLDPADKVGRSLMIDLRIRDLIRRAE